MERNYKIYYHKNKINEKYYIGLTCQNVNKRWKNGNGYKEQVFYNAIQKYGWNNFEHVILEDNLTQEEAKDKEQYYIEKYNSLVPNGYNITKGGDTNYKKGNIICLEDNIIFHDIDELMIFYENNFKNQIVKSDIIDCCNYNIRCVKIPWKEQYLHFQYYTKTFITYIKDIKTVESIYESRMERKKGSNEYRINNEYPPYKRYKVCSQCGNIYLQEKNKSLHICNDCRKRKKYIIF